MLFPPSFLDEIRARVPISQIVGARVRFDPKKSNTARGDYWACCPFHGEKTPSFHCDDRRGRYHCFGCGANGDIFRFLTELDGLSFSEAVEKLAALAGLALPKPDAFAAGQIDKRTGLYDVLEQAARFFERNLQQSSTAEAAAARTYLQQRQIGASAQKQFRLGLAPGGNNALKQFLEQAKIDTVLQQQSGLLAESEQDDNSYDRFRSRIMFPITDIKGRVIAFGGRALSPQARAKYLNSPETELFHKGRVLYNLAPARQAMRGLNGAPDQPLIVVEGYVDVVALAQAGFGSAVAPLGTALTEEQMTLLWRFCPLPVLCFDGDKAGQAAAWRALDRALPLLQTGVSLQFAVLPEGQDPDDIIRADGRARFAELLAGAAPLADILWQREITGQNFTTPESRALLEKRLYSAVSAIKDSGLRRYYMQDMKQRLWDYFRPALNRGHKRGQNLPGQSGRFAAAGAFNRSAGFGGGLVTRNLANSAFVRSARGKSFAAAFTSREAAILALLAAHPALWHENFDVLAQMEFQNAELRAFYKAQLEILGEGGLADNAGAMQARLEQKGQKAVLDKITGFMANLGVKNAQASASIEQARTALKQALALYRRAHSLHKQIREIEADLAMSATNRDFARLLALREELRRADDLEAAPDDI
ncbi:MAG: DNA primase [Candidatus Tokpelaia sp.]|nr:MAG: DNA primase [Candidatus Tokpelaia sp.]KAA6205759.1 MAG: DNA primase [Candidatus Tokpelaia sp.]